MLNVEKYLGAIKSEIDANACASKSCLIAKVRRNGIKQDCDRTTCRDCEDESIEWLFSEYEPPLLENDDGLQPGDWIMVRNHESGLWNRRQFLCFYEHLFIAADDGYSPLVGGMFSSWKFARLPMEGE